MTRDLPDFLCLGVQRGATTWLHQVLSKHPEAFLPEKKELHFFNHHLGKGVAWYQAYFQNRPESAKASGEITPTYFHEARFQDIRGLLPSAKMIVIFREPFARALSAYGLLRDKYPGKTFEECCQQTPYFIDLSLYSKKLNELLDVFPPEQVLTLLHDDIERDAEAALQRVCEFLGINPELAPQELDRRVNQVVRPDLQDSLNKMGLSWMIQLVKSNPLTDRLARSMFSKKAGKKDSKLSSSFFSQLQERFLEDIAELEPILGRDLSEWKDQIRSRA